MSDGVPFVDRADAARQLLPHLARFRGRDVVVLAVPRGGVPLGAVIAEALGAPLDVALVHKLRHPLQPEVAIGAVDEHGTITPGPAGFLGTPPDALQAEVALQVAALRARRSVLSVVAPAVHVTNRHVIVVDDGVATGSTLLAAVGSARSQGAAHVAVAVPCGAPSALRALARVADDVVCPHAPDTFRYVGAFYQSFDAVDDGEVRALLARSRRLR